MNIIERIRKLFALGSSPNEHEAAQALRRAQEMMEEYGLNPADILASEIVEKPVLRQGGATPPQHEAVLCSRIASAFGCRIIHHQTAENCRWNFIGIEHRAVVAAYLADILLRKLRSARRAYICTMRRCDTVTKTKRADEYCLGWVAVVSQKLKTFTGTSDECAAVEAYYVQHYSGLANLSPISRKVKRSRYSDFEHGITHGRDIELQHGVSDSRSGSSLLEA